MRSPEAISESPTEPTLKKPTLMDIFRGRKLTHREIAAINILESVSFEDLNTEQKIAVFNYSVFQELGPLTTERLKYLYGEIREDAAETSQTRITTDNFLVDRYDAFDKRLELETDPLVKGLEEKFFLTHPEAFEALELINQGLNNRKVSKRMGIPESEIKKIIRALTLFGKIYPKPFVAERVNRRSKLLWEVIDLREEHLGNQEIVEKTKQSPAAIEDAAKFLIWANLVTPFDRRDNPSRKRAKKMVEREIRLIRLKDEKAVIVVKDLSDKIGVSPIVIRGILSEIEDVGPSNTRTWRNKATQDLADALQNMDSNAGRVNLKQLAMQFGLTYFIARKTYHELEGVGVPLPPMLRQQRINLS